MLKIFTRKLCPLLSLAIATMGCGKKIADDSTTQSVRNIERQEPPAALVIKLESNEAQKFYSIDRNAYIMLPDKLFVRGGNATGTTVVISYNIEFQRDTNFDYQCIYKSTSTSEVIPLEKCVNSNGDVFSEVAGHEFPISFGKLIGVKVQNGPDAAIDVIYTIDWI